MTDTANKEARAINKEMLETVFLINRIAHRALSAEERSGSVSRATLVVRSGSLLVQMAAIENLARSALSKEARELLELAAAKDQG